MRLVLYGRGPESKSDPIGALYPPDAGSYTHPWWTFGLDEHQELPRVEPGAIVDVDVVDPAGSVIVQAAGVPTLMS